MENIGSKEVINSIEITYNDLESVNNYIQKRQTAILVIMFTDIVGYTRLTEEMGEEYVATLIKHHNDILTTTIEQNNFGKVIKYIGDSVMAIFSEPTKAVEISQIIHNRLDEFNVSFPELEDIKIRIGLHMGQVAVDNNIQGDIFGRHVNRASRIEGLAGPRQTYISYPVFDSAKGWLQDNGTISWKYHGEYFLKGIDKPAEIYQVYNSEIEKPSPPKNGKKRRKVPSALYLIIALILGALVTVGLYSYSKTKLYFFDFNIDNVFINGEKLYVDGNRGDHKRLVLNKFKPGESLLYYDISPNVRYYSLIDVRRGENLTTPIFKRFNTPYFEFETTLDNPTFSSVRDKELTYITNDNEVITDKVSCMVNITKEMDGKIIKYSTTWKILRNGEVYKSGTIKSSQDIESKEVNMGEWVDLPRSDMFFIRSRASSRLDYYKVEVNIAWY